MTVGEEKSEQGASEGALRAESVKVVRVGHGANCSSVGSVVDTLFVAATVGGAVLAAVLAAMSKENVKVVGRDEKRDEKREAQS